MLLPAAAFAALTEADMTQMLGQGDQLYRQGQYNEATEIYIELYGETGDTLYEGRLERSKKCRSLLKAAEEARRWGDLNGAMEGYEAILALNPEDMAVRETLSQVRQKLGLEIPQASIAPSSSTSSSTPPSGTPAKPTSQPAGKTTRGEIAGHQYVDLGLPSGVKWATCNIGATKPTDHGDFYAWGETSVKPRYEYSKAKMNGTSLREISGMKQYDAARSKWGATWRLPTGAEVKELIESCVWTTEKDGGQTVLKGTGKNGNVIILPATGFREDGDYNHSSHSGYCWCSTNWNVDDSAGALTYRLGGLPSLANFDFYLGMPIRPVSD